MTSKRTGLLVVALLVLSSLGPALSIAAAAPQTETAQLAIDQPHYVEKDAKTTTENGTTVYHASGVPLEISPQNFEANNVVDYGVLTDGGNAELSYNDAFEEFVFTADKQGTYTLYFSVERHVSVANESGNGTRVETRQQRYTAKIRLAVVADMVHQPASDLEATRKKAEKWDDWNATVQDVQGIVGNSVFAKVGLAKPPTTEETMQGMVDSYLTFKAPLYMLTGNFTQIVTLITFTLGGWLFVATIILPLLGTIGVLAYRSNRFETVEAEEGRLSKRVGIQQQKEDEQALANGTHNDVWEDDYLADAMRNLGDDPLTAVTRLYSKLRPRFAFHARLQAMAASGWVAVVDRRVSGDGGDDDTVTVAEAHLEPAGSVDEGADTVSLDVDPDSPLIDALDWDQTEIWEDFDLREADIDPKEVRTTPIDVYDIRELVELTDLDMRQFEDESHAAQNMVELLEYVREHPLTDDHGKPGTLRYGLEHHLRAARLLEDRFHMPIDSITDLFEKAIIEHDAGAEAQRTLENIREGSHA